MQKKKKIIKVPTIDSIPEGKTILPAELIINKLGSSIVISVISQINLKNKYGAKEN